VPEAYLVVVAELASCTNVRRSRTAFLRKPTSLSARGFRVLGTVLRTVPGTGGSDSSNLSSVCRIYLFRYTYAY
jgi:hypothetical protein